MRLRLPSCCAFLAAALTLVQPAGAVAVQDTDRAELPLWVVSDGESTVHLLGSVHMLRPEAYPLHPALTEAFEASETVVFELDFDELEASVGVMLDRGSLAGPESLPEVLPEGTYEQLEGHLRGMGVPPQVFENMKPWMATMMLSSLAIQQAGYDADSGVDFHFFDRAKAEGKEIVALESVDDQIEVFDGLSMDAQIAFLETTLERVEDAAGRMEELTDLWLDGDIEGLAHHLTETLEAHPELEERLLHRRNRQWVPRIEEVLREPGTAMVVVGAGHLVGEGSVVQLLRDRGYDVTRSGGS